jgi:hypothetical protein
MNSDGLSFDCPVCGALVPRKAKACPECGACEKSGWSDDRLYDGLDLPDEDDSSARLGAGKYGRMSGRDRFVWVVTVVVLIAFVWLILRGAW